MKERAKPGTKEHVWVDRGSDPSAYCNDCKQPTNSARHIERAGHHLYVCAECSAKRIGAPAIRLSGEGDA